MKVLWKLLGIALALVVAFVAWALLRTESPEEREMHQTKGGIAMCWQDQARKSLTPREARTIAAVCERMEADLRQKYRREP